MFYLVQSRGTPAALLGCTWTLTHHGYIPLARGTGIHWGIPLQGYLWEYTLNFVHFQLLFNFYWILYLSDRFEIEEGVVVGTSERLSSILW